MREYPKTRLEQIEEERIRHVGNAIKGMIAQALLTREAGDLEDVVNRAAIAAVAAAERFPADGWPLGSDLNSPPAGVHPAMAEALDRIDAGIQSGDGFNGEEEHLFLAAHIQRWSLELRERRENDWRNRLADDVSPEL